MKFTNKVEKEVVNKDIVQCKKSLALKGEVLIEVIDYNRNGN